MKLYKFVSAVVYVLGGVFAWYCSTYVKAGSVWDSWLQYNSFILTSIGLTVLAVRIITGMVK